MERKKQAYGRNRERVRRRRMKREWRKWMERRQKKREGVGWGE